jgi:RNA polymerase sigma-70 factor (ECF subfamily)
MVGAMISGSSEPDQPESAIAPSAGAGDPAVWLADHGDYLFRYARRHLRDRAAAEDLVQETFLSAFRARDRFEGRSGLRTWLTGILRHKLIDHWKAKARRDERESSDAWLDGLHDDTGHMKVPPTAWSNDPARLLEQGELQARVRHCLDLLPERLRLIANLKLVERRETDAMVSELGVTANHLGVLLHRARTRLWHCVNEYMTTRS